MFGFRPEWMPALVAAALVLALGIRLPLFRASCALADVVEPGWGKSFVLVALSLLVAVPLGWGLVAGLGAYEPDPALLFGPLRVLGGILALLAAAGLAGLIYRFALATSSGRGLMIAGIEVLLSCLLGVLATALLLVALAVVQVVNRPGALPKAPPAPAQLSPGPIRHT